MLHIFPALFFSEALVTRLKCDRLQSVFQELLRAARSMTLSASTAVGTSYEQLGAPKSQTSLEIFLMHCEVPRSHLQTLHQLKDSVPPPTTRREQIRLANVWGRISACPSYQILGCSRKLASPLVVKFAVAAIRRSLREPSRSARPSSWCQCLPGSCYFQFSASEDCSARPA